MKFKPHRLINCAFTPSILSIQLTFAVLGFLLVSGCDTSQLVKLETLELPHLYIANTTEYPPVIDGKINPTEWDHAPWSEPFIDIEGVIQPKFSTRFKLLWDTEHLYILAQLEEPHIWGTLKQRDTVVFYNNDFEVFIDPDGDTHKYMEIEINALNTVWDLFLERPYRNKVKADNGWDIDQLQTAVGHRGTLNNPSDTDQDWVIEMALPWKSLDRGIPTSSLPVNEFWRMNFSRVQWEFELQNSQYQRKKNAQGNFLPEHNWVWSPQGVINMHEPEHWGYVYFSEGNAPSHKIARPEEAPLLQWMYGEYAKHLRLTKQQKTAASSTQALWNGKLITLTQEVYQDTLYWVTKNPFTAKTYKIRNDGKLLIE